MDDKPTHRARPAALRLAQTLRRPQTPAETILWNRLKNGQLDGLKFRRQHPIDHYVVDFYCAPCRLVVEIDGETHLDSEDGDAERTAYLVHRGHRVLRFWNTDVYENIDGVLQQIMLECGRHI